MEIAEQIEWIVFFCFECPKGSSLFEFFAYKKEIPILQKWELFDYKTWEQIYYWKEQYPDVIILSRAISKLKLLNCGLSCGQNTWETN